MGTGGTGPDGGSTRAVPRRPATSIAKATLIDSWAPSGATAHGMYIDPNGRAGRSSWSSPSGGGPGRSTGRRRRLSARHTSGFTPTPRSGAGPSARPRSEVQARVKKLSDELAPGSVELVYRWVATIFKAAVGDRMIAASPCIRIALPEEAGHRGHPALGARRDRVG